MNKGKQNENEQTKMLSENQEGVQYKKNTASKGREKQKKAQAQKILEIQEVRETMKALMQKQIKSFSELTKELHSTFVIFTIVNNEFSRAVDVLEERNRRNKIKYLLLGGLSFTILAVAMLIGYYYSYPGEDISILYISLLRNAGLAMLIGIGLGLTLNKKS